MPSSLFTAGALLFGQTAFAAMIALEPMKEPPSFDFAGLFFQPTNRSVLCDDSQCGGTYELDLTASDRLSFEWSASSRNDMYITIDGKGRTRIEFQMTFDCSVDPPPYQEIRGDALSFDFDFADRAGISQSYTYNSDNSFLLLGKCDGCGECEVYTRMQFDPSSDDNNELHLSFTRFQFSADYDTSNIVTGSNIYDWSTSKYIWMRDSNKRRELLDGWLVPTDNHRRRVQATNVYEVLPLSDLMGADTTTIDDTNDTTNTTTTTTGTSSSPFNHMTAAFTQFIFFTIMFWMLT